MKLSKFRNAIVYRATLPSIETVEGHLHELPYSELGETEFARSSFVPNPLTGELVTPIAGGYAIVVRRDEKIIPQHVVMKEANERIQRIESACGAKLKRADRNNIIQDARVQLCKQAFIKSSLFLALYNTEDNLLIINTANKNIAGMVGAMLVKVIGSVKTVTINISDIKNGLTTRLQNHLNGEEPAFEGFEVGDYVQLSRLADQKEVIRYSADHTSVTSEILESLNTGFIVDNLELRGCGVSFLLTDKFHFPRINTQDNSFDDDDD
ncbi:recombination-associated protein RdgC [Klebsiella grimontii]|uniref:recombination-associated protein RdgC n=1 Tax=Klebsiella grimontii TaxID=2058152 RepID=UPI0015EACDB2|nr:recombination-associated protein RdgC [Klebsiella grimontii]MBE8895633.1 recombination-associated protein RdgC [Klebsiella grimontii]QLT88808.1 recombination-associated protein RdgC [Klebsiella grimontii]QQQ23577.1 recombination-associated protein RdgC [Klebsiella grimontii]